MTDPSVLPPPVVPGLSGLTVLARGGYATVYRAVQESVSRDVAVKIENRTLESERDRRRFLREARAAGRMSSHPHVVDLFDAGVTPEGYPYLMMELCDGSYAERMKTSPLGAVEARDVGVKIADALADAHALGVCHRDVKPANMLITRFGEPALADFGLAILTETRDASLTLDVLTPAYAPPELFQQSQPSTAVDVYALCATLYAIMQGRPPRWRADRNPSLVTLMELFNEPIPDLPGVPRPFLDLLRAGMANEPDERPTAERLRDLLAAIPLPPPGSGGPPGSGSPGSAGPPGSAAPPSAAGARGAAGAAPPPPDSSETPTVPTPKRRWRFVAAIAGGLAALALAVATGIWYGSARGTPPAEARRVPATSAPAEARRVPATSAPAVACPLPASVADTACPARPECYDRLAVDGGVARAIPRPCDQTHTWETFALGALSTSTSGVAHQTVKRDPTVKLLCIPANLAALTGDSFDWQIEVLPPTPEQFAGGDRTFRCLGGKGTDRLTKATLRVGD